MSVEIENRRLGSIIIIIAGFLLITGVIFWQVYPSISKKSQIPPPIASPVYIQRVSLLDAFQAYNQKTAIFLDVRSAEAFQSSHISSSKNIPLGELPDRLNELDKQRWIISYCT
jgi:hypothetical protein